MIEARAMRPSESVTLFLAGDVMTGRGIDQALPHPGDPILYETYVKSARDYVTLAERAHGAIPRPLAFGDVWGDALAELEHVQPDLRFVNLETAITTADHPAAKGINYRMNPRNAAVLSVAGLDACVLANNHTLDWGEAGLLETLATLERIGIAPVGACRTQSESRRPAIFPARSGRVLVTAYGVPTSGVPQSWAASDDRPGINVLADLGARPLQTVAADIGAVKRPGDIAVVSLHWGSNWGYDVSLEQRDFAHGLIDEAGADLVWGHSSHHPKAIEVYRGKLVLYGCGDFLNDYEGIAGEEAFRGDLVLMYLPEVSLEDGRLVGLTMVPLQVRGFRLRRASPTDAQWLCSTVDREGRKTGTRVRLTEDNRLVLGFDRQVGAEAQI